jgi:hypothetical protein
LKRQSQNYPEPGKTVSTIATLCPNERHPTLPLGPLFEIYRNLQPVQQLDSSIPQLWRLFFKLLELLRAQSLLCFFHYDFCRFCLGLLFVSAVPSGARRDLIGRLLLGFLLFFGYITPFVFLNILLHS